MASSPSLTSGPASLSSLADAPEAQQVYSLEQLAARRRSSLRRAAAMVSPRDMILGLEFDALSPASFSRLLVIGSPFLFRDSTPAGAEDVRDYLWQHWPQFDARGEGRDHFRAMLDRQIVPRWQRWRYSRQAWQARIAAVYVAAAEQIRELVEVAFADEPPGGEGAGRVCATLEAQMIDTFARLYRWPAERTRHTPLRQLYQFLRCNDGIDYDPEEAAVIAADLKAANAPQFSGSLNSQPSTLN